MESEAFTWLTRIKDVEREHTTTRFAIEHLKRSLGEKTIKLLADLKEKHVNQANDRLEATYIVRLFSEFERALKEYLYSKKIKIPWKAESLINRVASRVRIQGIILVNAHQVRNQRNIFVHHLEQKDEPLTMRKSTSYLTTFLDRLKIDW